MLSLREKLKEQILSAKTAAIGRIAEKILSHAVAEGADSITVDAKGAEGEVVFYDGKEIKGRLAIPEKIKDDIFLVFKELSGVSGKQKTGMFKKQILGKKIIFFLEVVILPPAERIIIKLENRRFDLIEIGRLGFEKKSLEKIKKFLAGRRGFVLDIGPFNSGKTTALYSFINHLNQSNLNITTLEKEISYDIPAVNQSELSFKEGFGYPFPLSSLLRQDPDVVMIDEICDKEAVEASLHLADRGYFVLAGIYGTSFSATFDFLSGLGVSLPLFSSTAKIIINQRLARRNCPYCLESRKITREEAERIKEVIDVGAVLKKMRQEKINPMNISCLEDMNIFKSRGCGKCRRSGQSGEVGIFEVLEVDETVKKHLRSGHFAAAAAENKNQGCFTLSEAAFAKLSLGIINAEEFLKIVSI